MNIHVNGYNIFALQTVAPRLLQAVNIVDPNYERMNTGIAAKGHVANIHDYATQSPMKIDYLNVKKAALVLRALNHKLRQQILKLLDENQKMTVTDIYVQLRLEQSVASQHLAILRRAGIVKTERDGKYIYYRINEDRLEQINHLVEDLLK